MLLIVFVHDFTSEAICNIEGFCYLSIVFGVEILYINTTLRAENTEDAILTSLVHQFACDESLARHCVQSIPEIAEQFLTTLSTY